jgi:Non-ribosomal peptide synthetase modules and related proteins
LRGWRSIWGMRRPGALALRAYARPAEIPLSYAQRRLWFLHRLEGDSAGYIIPVAVRLAGELDVGALERALCDVVERHESLRTVFAERDGVARQEILDARAVRPSLAVVGCGKKSLRGCWQLPRGRSLRSIVSRRCGRICMGCPRASTCCCWCCITLPGTGGRWACCCGMLRAAMGRGVRGRHRGLRRLRCNMRTTRCGSRRCWAARARRGARSRASSFWREHLEGLPEQIELPSDRARPAVASHRGGSVGLLLDGELHAGLLRLARSGGASLFMVLQAGLVGLLSRLGGGSDIALGSPIAGRTDSALDDLVGFFVNTLVLRTDVSGAPSMRDLVGRVRTGNLLAYSHQEVPFERLVEVLNPARSLARHPLFQVMLAFQNNAPARFEVPGLAARFEPLRLGGRSLTCP